MLRRILHDLRNPTATTEQVETIIRSTPEARVFRVDVVQKGQETVSQVSHDLGRLGGNRVVVVFFALVAAVIVAACEEPLARPPIAHITGRLTYNGKLLRPGHAVVFMEPHAGYLAFGTTDDRGRFVVDSWKKGEMVPGRYKLYISPPQTEESTKDSGRFDDYERAAPAKPVPIDFPERYRAMETSGLEYKIVVGENDVAVDLVDEPRPATDEMSEVDARALKPSR